MGRRFVEPQLVIASHNPGKVAEITALIGQHGVSVVSAGELSLDEPEETGTTFVENAVLKARAAAAAAGLPALADDSGLAVDALEGNPGIYSARWAGPNKNFDHAMQRIEDKLAGQSNRCAKFICVLALAWPQSNCLTFEGEVSGELIWPPRGDRGFGYDPMFGPDGRKETCGEMDPNLKHSISHRANAFRKLVAALFND